MANHLALPLTETDPEAAAIIRHEEDRQQNTLELIASENHVSLAVRTANASVFTNKYAEGYPGKRYYGGCVNMDVVEDLARERAKKLFNAAFVNVQPHSGAQANVAVYCAALKPGDTILSLDLAHGGHLTHGLKVNFSGAWFNIVPYGVEKETEQVSMDTVRKLALEHKPQLIICGASAYPRMIDFTAFAEIATECGARLMADIAHIAGLIAVGLHPTSIGIADFTTTTTHKTLRGPRGGMIFCNTEDDFKLINRWVFPGTQGGPLMHTITAKAVAFGEALRPDFKEYQQQIVNNAQALAEGLKSHGYRLVSGGTDNHLMLVDLRDVHPDLTGKQAEAWLEVAGIITNKNMIPFDERKPTQTSGLRLGTPALTTRGMKEAEMKAVAGLIHRALSAGDDEAATAKVRSDVLDLCGQFPLPHA
ncbi:MAG: serine hydroxymethyltransferase [Phycisphaerae bacterium]|nr:serine hydroxymethyltransferase [Phycisphaerae bacterium]